MGVVSNNAHEEREAAHGVVEIAPSHITALGATGHSVGNRVTRWETVGAGVVWKETPGNETSQQLTERPKDGQHGQKVSGCKWKELEEKRSVHRKVLVQSQSWQIFIDVRITYTTHAAALRPLATWATSNRFNLPEN